MSLSEAGGGIEGADVKSMPVSQSGLPSEPLEEELARSNDQDPDHSGPTPSN
jgi:hypothetical protein